MLARPEVKSVALPWGADHMPGIAAGPTERSFARVDHEWLRAIVVRSSLDVQSFERTWSCATLCDAVAFGVPEPDTFASSLLWGFLWFFEVGE